MSGVSKRKNVALVGGAALLLIALVGLATFSIWWSQNAYHQQAQNNANTAARDAATRVQRQCGGLTDHSLAQCAYQVIDAARERQRSEYNLEAQRKLANGGNWLIIIGGIEILLTGVGLWIIYGQLHATRVGFQTENRAWIEILPDFSRGDLIYTQTGEFRLKAKFACKNIGRTVALNVGIRLDLVPDPTLLPKSKGVDEFKKQLFSNTQRVDTRPLFPTREMDKEWEVGRVADEMLLEPATEDEMEAFFCAVCVGVRYNTIFDKPGDPPHITMEVLSLRRIVDGLAAYVISGRETVPQGDLALSRLILNMTEVT